MAPTVSLTPVEIDPADFDISVVFSGVRGQDSWDMRFEGNDMRSVSNYPDSGGAGFVDEPTGYVPHVIDIIRHPRTYFDDDSLNDFSFRFAGTKRGTTYRTLESCIRKGHSVSFGVLVQNGATACKLKRVSLKLESGNTAVWDIDGSETALKWTGVAPGGESANADEAYYFTLTRKMDGTFSMQGTWIEYQ